MDAPPVNYLKLHRDGTYKVVGSVLCWVLYTWLGWTYARTVTDRDVAALWITADLPIRAMMLIVYGFGLADEAEYKGYGRNYGWWALLSLVGLLIILLLPNRRFPRT